MATFSFFTTAELRSRGMTIDTIRVAIQAGELERVIRGWYCSPDADRSAVLALRMGGRLGCLSALHLHGAWLPPDQGTHVMFPSHASGRRSARRVPPAGTAAHWHAKDARTGSSYPVAPIDLAVEQLLACQPPDFCVAVLDSLLHRRLVTRNRLEALVARGPQRTRALGVQLDGSSESGIESVVRFRLRAAGIATRVQVVVRDRFRVDVLIDDWLVLEVDGREAHTGADAFVRDRERSAAIMRDGRIVLHFAYATVMYRWDFVLAAVVDVMRQHAPTF